MKEQVKKTIELYDTMMRMKNNSYKALGANIPKNEVAKYKQALANSHIKAFNDEQKFFNAADKLSADEQLVVSKVVRL